MAQKRRQEALKRRKDQRSVLLCVAGGLGLILVSLLLSFAIFGTGPSAAPVSAPVSSPLPYNPSEPFSLSDLSAQQLVKMRKGEQLSLSDGPRGVSIGDTLDTLLSRYPTDYTGVQPDMNMQILYCASVFENINGILTALPPRALLTDESGDLVVTFLSPTSPYPDGTRDSYGSYEHIFCRYTVSAQTMTVTSITLGMDR